MSVSREIRINSSFYAESSYFKSVEINRTKFAFINTPIQTKGDLSIDLKNHNVVLLAPLSAENNIHIQAITLICLSSLYAEKGGTQLNTSRDFVALGCSVKSFLSNKVVSGRDQFHHPIIVKRRKMIFQELQKGLSQQDGNAIVDGLIEIFDATTNISGENPTIDVEKAFQFFNIPLRA